MVAFGQCCHSLSEACLCVLCKSCALNTQLKEPKQSTTDFSSLAEIMSVFYKFVQIQTCVYLSSSQTAFSSPIPSLSC